jgi:hypothetical protein
MPQSIDIRETASLVKEIFPSGISIDVSQEIQDSKWDDFLLSSCLGQYQQSSRWAAAKSLEGWQIIRIVLSNGDRTMGGFQLLYRHTRLGRIGYISKGPVIDSDSQSFWDLCLKTICKIAEIQEFRGIVVQAPDLSQPLPEWFSRYHFVPEKIMGIIDASLWFMLGGDPQMILSKMPGYNRTFIRQAIKRKTTIREGNESDLGIFFDLMLQTCNRQKESPNPGSESAIRQIWELFNSPGTKMRLAFAEYEGKPLAALTCIAFGDRITLWKKGWCSQLSHLRPNHLLYYDFLCWASRSGYKFCDFYSVRRDTAIAIQNSQTLSDAQAQSRDRFHLGFGGQPILLPQPWIYIPKNFGRFLYQATTVKAVGNILRKFKLA